MSLVHCHVLLVLSKTIKYNEECELTKEKVNGHCHFYRVPMPHALEDFFLTSSKAGRDEHAVASLSSVTWVLSSYIIS